MPQVTIEIDPRQIESAIQQMNERERWKIAKEIITEQFKDTVKKFRQTIKRKGLTYKQINNIVEKAREEFYAKSRNRR
ncbi:MAG: hypothetical protein AB1349_14575 [Elusimicrobiota bacterium]